MYVIRAMVVKQITYIYYNDLDSISNLMSAIKLWFLNVHASATCIQRIQQRMYNVHRTLHEA